MTFDPIALPWVRQAHAASASRPSIEWATTEQTQDEGELTVDIVLSVDIATTPDRLFEAITTSKGLAGWHTPQSKAEPQKGALIEFGFGPEATITFRVDEFEPRRRVVWSGVEGPPEWQGTHVAFDIAPAGDLATLRFSQTGFAPDLKVFGYFSYLWAHTCSASSPSLKPERANRLDHPCRITASQLLTSDTILPEGSLTGRLAKHLSDGCLCPGAAIRQARNKYWGEGHDGETSSRPVRGHGQR
jgi:uncharacterized protein YndB with AHSA1/START domain